MKKLVRSISLLTIAALALTALSCGSKSTNITNPDEKVVLTKEPITLEYWRLWDDSSVFDPYIIEYQQEHPNINIEVKKTELTATYTTYDYQRDVIKAIADGAGPDMFMINNTWLPYHVNQIAPVNSTQITLRDFKTTFPTVVQNDLIYNDRIYGIPYSIDNLVLYYNTDIFDEKGIRQPPKTWQELANLVPKLTEKDSRGRLLRSAISLGGTDGMPRAADILAALMMQYGAEMTSADHTTATFNLPVPGSNPPRFGAQDALSYYTQFADPSSPLYTYTDNKDAKGNRVFPSDLQAFMEGKTAMFIGYSYNIKSIRKFAPKVRFETATLPQQQLQNPVTIAGYWAETVSKNSQHPNEAWDFIKFMVSRGNQTSFTQQTGTVSARKELQDTQAGRYYYGTVVEQIPYAKSWYRKNTLDVEDIFTRMITNVLINKVSSAIAIETAVRDINTL